jgi:DNA-binding transcriptional LysR family regulator
MSTSPPLSMEQLRTLVAVADAGSFSGAARRLGRTQPAVSYAIAGLESHLGFALFERGRRHPVLTDAGATILAYARRISLLGDELQASAAGLTQGLEGILSVSIDSFFPVTRLSAALAEFAAHFPSVTPNVRIESRDAVLERVLDRECVMGLSAADGAWPLGIEARDFATVTIVAVVAPHHPLGRQVGPIPASVVRDTIQITNKPAGKADDSRDVAVNSARLWRVSDVSTAVALLVEGIGWGYLPLHIAQPQIGSGRLTELPLATRARGELTFSLLHRADAPRGPAGRWLAERLSQPA